MFGNEMFALPYRQVIQIKVIPDNSFFNPGPDPLPKFFQVGKGEVKVFLESVKS